MRQLVKAGRLLLAYQLRKDVQKMYCTRKVTDDIHWVGGNDHRLALFENLFPIPRGVSYNAYVIMDEKTALLDTTDPSVGRIFLDNVAHVLGDRSLDYLVINHMEPDHCSMINKVLHKYPKAQLVTNAKALQMIHQFFDIELEGRTILVNEMDTLELGQHTLQFVMAPMVHWPEAMVTYEQKEKVLFSADAFGTFGALDGNLFSDEVDFERDWLDDARRYYTNIVGKYGKQVQNLLKKAATLDIQMICPLHGPVWRSDLAYFIDKYDKWSSYTPEDQAVVIMYGSMYGNTEKGANMLAAALGEAGVKDVKMYDISSTDVSVLIGEAFRCSHIVLAAPTYNGGLYPKMENLLSDMKALSLQKRTIALIENGTWAAAAAKLMRRELETMKEMQILDDVVTIKSAVKEETAEAIQQLAGVIAKTL